MAYSGLIFNETDATGDSFSDRISMKRASLFSIQIVSTGTTATFEVYQSNLPDPDDTSDWVLSTDIVVPAITAAGSVFVNVGNAAARYYRVKVVGAATAGQLSIHSFAGEA